MTHRVPGDLQTGLRARSHKRPFLTLRFWFEHDGWIVLCFDAVTGAPPGQPWRSADITAIVASMAAGLRLLTSSPVTSLRTIPELMAGESTRVSTAATSEANTPPKHVPT